MEKRKNFLESLKPPTKEEKIDYSNVFFNASLQSTIKNREIKNLSDKEEQEFQEAIKPPKADEANGEIDRANIFLNAQLQRDIRQRKRSQREGRV